MADLREEEARQKLIPLLQSHEAFAKSALSIEQIVEFAKRAHIRFFLQGETMIQQSEEGDEFFFVISGEAKAININYDPPRLLNYIGLGEEFGLRAILRNSIRAATVIAVLDTVVAVYSREDWFWLTNLDSGIGRYFEEIEQRFDAKTTAQFPGLKLQPDELIVRAVKRHAVAFLATLVWPIMILIAPLLFLILARLFGIPLVEAIGNTFAIMAFVPFIALALLITLYNYLDWRNDDLIITTKRVIHIERLLFFGESRREVPLTQIQSVTVIQHGWLDLFFDVDDIEIKTAAIGTITVDNIAAAQNLSRIILQEQQRAKERASAADVAAVRRLVADRVSKSVLIETKAAEPKLKVVSPSPRLPAVPVPKVPVNYFWPRTREVTTFRGEPAIVWRKHYFILLQNIFLPVLAIAAALFLLATSFFTLPVFDYLANDLWLIQLMLGLAVLGSLLWYFWEYDDWRRDIYVVTSSRIVDVESSSFRLKGEQFREGSFDSIQNITYRIPNLFSQIINLGDVVIETAGVGKGFTFLRVFNPSTVQTEIFSRWDNYQQRRRERQRDDETKHIMTVLGEYHDMTNPINSQKPQG